ncbi:hypothetical protein [Flavobacterium sp.]|uniref:hypothetical protein n=1 Tax=Flavobacterium sp. TaxID=239 RepID=UPI0011FE732D|nr:hypothetical protein [Flavobacterium sp.]RZJ71200.1 MAG: hypothetical protein EOO49_10640 [Flavobacterium sp.]
MKALLTQLAFIAAFFAPLLWVTLRWIVFAKKSGRNKFVFGFFGIVAALIGMTIGGLIQYFVLYGIPVFNRIYYDPTYRIHGAFFSLTFQFLVAVSVSHFLKSGLTRVSKRRLELENLEQIGQNPSENEF